MRDEAKKIELILYALGLDCIGHKIRGGTSTVTFGNIEFKLEPRKSKGTLLSITRPCLFICAETVSIDIRTLNDQDFNQLIEYIEKIHSEYDDLIIGLNSKKIERFKDVIYGRS